MSVWDGMEEDLEKGKDHSIIVAAFLFLVLVAVFAVKELGYLSSYLLFSSFFSSKIIIFLEKYFHITRVDFILLKSP